MSSSALNISSAPHLLLLQMTFDGFHIRWLTTISDGLHIRWFKTTCHCSSVETNILFRTHMICVVHIHTFSHARKQADTQISFFPNRMLLLLLIGNFTKCTLITLASHSSRVYPPTLLSSPQKEKKINLDHLCCPYAH